MHMRQEAEATSDISIDDILRECELPAPSMTAKLSPNRSKVWGKSAERVRVVESLVSRSKQIDPEPFKLTIVVPVFNEENTVRQVLDSLVAQPIPGDVEIIVVDDGSTDRTKEILQATWHHSHVCVRHEVNRGKGAAVRTGISRATGTHLLVFDADSEYDPADIPKLVAPILNGRAEVVYGVRVRGAGTAFPSIVNVFGNRLMTAATNSLYGSAISDLHTCLKLLPALHAAPDAVGGGGFRVGHRDQCGTVAPRLSPLRSSGHLCRAVARRRQEDSLVRRIPLHASAGQGSLARKHATRSARQIDRAACVRRRAVRAVERGGLVSSGTLRVPHG